MDTKQPYFFTTPYVSFTILQYSNGYFQREIYSFWQKKKQKNKYIYLYTHILYKNINLNAKMKLLFAFAIKLRVLLFS